MDLNKVSILSNHEDDLIRRRDNSRFGVTIFLCTIPLLDSAFVIFCLTRKKLGSSFDIVQSISLIYIFIAIATTLVGYYGIYKKNNLALRVSINLFTVQNLLVLLISANLFYLFLRYKHFFNEHKAPKFMVYLEKHRSLGSFLFFINFLLRILNFLLTWYCGELEASYEVINRNKQLNKDQSTEDQFHIDIKDCFEQIY